MLDSELHGCPSILRACIDVGLSFRQQLYNLEVGFRFHRFRGATNSVKWCRSSHIGSVNIRTHPDQLSAPQYVALRTCPHQRSLTSLYVNGIQISPPPEYEHLNSVRQSPAKVFNLQVQRASTEPRPKKLKLHLLSSQVSTDEGLAVAKYTGDFSIGPPFERRALATSKASIMA